MSKGSNEQMTVPSVDSGLFCFPPIKDIGVRAAGEGRGWVLQSPQILGNSDFLGSKRNLGKAKRSLNVCVFFSKRYLLFQLEAS